MIDYLINNAEKFNIGIIDDRKNHDRIEFHFEKVAVLMNNDCYFYGVKTLIYFTELDEINVTLEDEYMIGCINDISAINEIVSLTNFKKIYKR